VRYGIAGKLIDFGKVEEIPFPVLVEELLAWVDDVVDELGSRAEVEYARTILRQGASADRQLAVYRQAGDFRAVVDQVVEETREGVE
jgi:carboxylate-amine ligase